MVEPIESILVPTDGSDTAEAGARRAIDLAATAEADLHILSVVETRELEPSLSNGGSDEQSVSEALLESDAERAVESISDDAVPHLSGWVRTAVEWGVPFREINAYAETHDVDLVVMGTHGRTGLERFLGSVANKTLRTASVPVVMVPPEAAAIDVGDVSYDDVLLPTDGSAAAETAIDWGLSFADLYDGTIHTVYSVDTSLFGTIEDAAGVHNALERAGREALDTVRERATETDVDVVGTIGSGPAARVILSYVDSHDVDLIAMGTHGRSGIERYLIGSVTEGVVRSADVPVCCVPMEDR